LAKRRDKTAARWEDILNIHRAIAVLSLLGWSLTAARAEAADLKVFSTTAFKGVLEEIGPQFEKSTENKIIFTFAPTAALKTQIEQGADFDVAVLTLAINDALAAEGKLAGAPRSTVARAGMGVAIRHGEPKPDVSSVDAFKRALMNAKSIGFNGQGASRAGIEALFNKLGIAEALAPKIKLLQGGAPEGVAKGEAELGLSPVSEILPAPGVDLVGPFPSEIQSYLVLTAGVSATSKGTVAADAFIKFLTAPAAAAVLKAKGMEPG
jgi:molybdate transport system substrate-binding protein